MQTRQTKDMDIDRMLALTELDKAYIAGFFDGEGSVGMYHKKNGIALKLSLTQNTLDVLHDLWLTFGGALVTVAARENSRAYYELRIERRDHVGAVLRTFAKYVRIKQDQVQLVLGYLQDRDGLSDDDKADIVVQLKEMK